MNITEKLDALKADIKKNFPDVWIKDGEAFGLGERDSLWTGEGSYMPDGRCAFDGLCLDYKEKTYRLGVHKQLITLLDQHGFYAEQHDAGTFFIRHS